VARHRKTADDLFNSKPSPRTESMVAAAVPWAERIMKKIDNGLGNGWGRGAERIISLRRSTAGEACEHCIASGNVRVPPSYSSLKNEIRPRERSQCARGLRIHLLRSCNHCSTWTTSNRTYFPSLKWGIGLDAFCRFRS